MKKKITICLQKSKSEPQATVGSFDFVEADKGLLKIDATIELNESVRLRISGVFSVGNNSVSLLGFLRDEQVFLIMASWEKSAPYFGVQIERIGWLHIYFGNRK